MSKVQKRLLSIYLLLTITVLILDHLCPSSILVRIFKNLIILSLFVISLLTKKRFPIQILFTYAILFAATGDFLFAVSMNNEYLLHGLFAFFLAYILLILAFRRRLLPNKYELFFALPIAVLTGSYYFYLLPHIPPELRLFTPLSAVGLALVCWCGICAVLQKIYAGRPALICAAAGCLVLISDSAISAGVFLPRYENYFDPWLFNIIWGTFIPAWTLIAMISTEKDLYRKN